ncbi:ribonuclease P protein component 4 [Sulfolobus acidocaldarius]|uniref:Ribonuclease P protein component 4 n=3 Tax=Sulfolobus acidocaldarius TaxID=2285 RepID=RNP4_SULAC|nr:ribonuclease P [Sulfolobus acidocaldarius]Q4JCL6.1 RecName: Full=Ribonuclease P protein component 4; Short=RNase P component 4; AltName: Full=Rpp21 [Sulfolobus acidocaldarius DSM 639]AAY79463.1 conserved protein [Sulfolobus acidocaldarius DSM 639]AGE70013.1 hypothetical protein SacN8_00160 [Sulfolobus acidocaldarius N8]AGE72288.1 hypothetical protein SacRon12I_00160 [Sulfolobus acidocaldarius Ron12/I]WCM34045.1 ribonuclease P [Sulfolobus acidocaldarius DSM 639]
MKVKNVKPYKRRSLELIEMAIDMTKNREYQLAREYTKLAITYSRKFRFKIPIEYKRSICRKCYVPLVIGLTERRRIKNKVVIRTCLLCGWVRRYELKRDSKEGKGIPPRHKNRQERTQ